MPSITAGAVSGMMATLPMTVAMEAMFPRLSMVERYPLPPRRIMMRAADALGMKHELGEGERKAAALAGHFGYGAAMGGIYAGAVQEYLPGPWGGAVFGLGVWAGSYMGLLPAAGMHPHAGHEPTGRNLLMIAAHVVWGAALGAMTDRLDRAGQGPSFAGEPIDSPANVPEEQTT